jgi:hypothetical protein
LLTSDKKALDFRQAQKGKYQYGKVKIGVWRGFIGVYEKATSYYLLPITYYLLPEK